MEKESFMKYDYVGAPWPWFSASGNGGFNLRSVDVMMKACLAGCENGNEDVGFSKFVLGNHN